MMPRRFTAKKGVFALAQLCLGGVPLQRSVLALVNGRKKGLYFFREEPFIQGFGHGMPILCCGWPPGASGQGDIVGIMGIGELVLKHAEVLVPDGRWCVSVLWSGVVISRRNVASA